MVRLAGGVVAGPGRKVWTADADGGPAPGSPVAVSPRTADADTAQLALAELADLVRAGGPVAAGADVDLGHGVRSARTEGGAGDRRDAVLAALAVPGIAGRLGEPAAMLVALFGPDATKPLGAAAQLAVDEGRWAVVRFAVAASDVLGRGWRLAEAKARFNQDPDPRLLNALRAWVADLPVPLPRLTTAPATDRADRIHERAARATPSARVARDLGRPLSDLAATATAQQQTRQASRVLATLASTSHPAPQRAPDGAPQWMVHVKPQWTVHPGPRPPRRGTRSPPCAGPPAATLLRACRLVLADPTWADPNRADPAWADPAWADPIRADSAWADSVWADPAQSGLGGAGLAALWRASGDRPLARAVAAMPPSTMDRLAPLLLDEPLPGSLQTLARLPAVASARTVDLVASRVRAAIGVLLRQDAPELARAMLTRPHGPVLRAMVMTVTSWHGLGPAVPRQGQQTRQLGQLTRQAGPGPAVTAVVPRRRVRVPGAPPSALNDERWQGAWPDAVELGAAPDTF